MPGVDRYTLAMISTATERTISSSLAEYGMKEGALSMHPHDAGERRLNDGQVVRVFNDLGEVLVLLRIRSTVRPGVVSMPKGLWNRHTRNGSVATALIPDEVSEISGGACFNDARVEVGPANE